MNISVEAIGMLILTGAWGYLMWTVKRNTMKVDKLESRVVKVETVLEIMGDIRNDIQSVKTDVEVIKAKVNKS